jgi:C4-dicarboxylate transporter DctM subunit
MYSLYGGVATPSEAAGVGAALCMILAIAIYRLWRPDQIWHIPRDTMRESVMILTIIAAAVLFGYMLTSLYLTQTRAQAIADLHANKWVLMFLVNPEPALSVALRNGYKVLTYNSRPPARELEAACAVSDKSR